MILILKPKGRGNWRTSAMQIEGAHQLPMLVAAGHTITIGDAVFRICEVHHATEQRKTPVQKFNATSAMAVASDRASSWMARAMNGFGKETDQKL